MHGVEHPPHTDVTPAVASRHVCTHHYMPPISKGVCTYLSSSFPDLSGFPQSVGPAQMTVNATSQLRVAEGVEGW
eukprot:955589-Pelagomonas_calceolata.AAC.3